MSQSKHPRNRAQRRANRSRDRRPSASFTPAMILEQAKLALLSGKPLQAAWLASNAIAELSKQSPDSQALAEALEQRAAYSFIAAKQTPESRGRRNEKDERFKEAQDDAEKALSIRITLLGTDDHADLVLKHHNLGVFYTGNDQWTAARWHYERTEALSDKYREQDDPGFAYSLNHLGFVYCQVGEFDKAEAALRKALAWLQAIPVEPGDEAQRESDVQTITTQLEAIGTLRAEEQHVHGPDCDHSHDATQVEHVHGPSCGHAQDEAPACVHADGEMHIVPAATHNCGKCDEGGCGCGHQTCSSDCGCKCGQ
jgi:tetratricopeptide (TPR) repeat protein